MYVYSSCVCVRVSLCLQSERGSEEGGGVVSRLAGAENCRFVSEKFDVRLRDGNSSLDRLQALPDVGASRLSSIELC